MVTRMHHRGLDSDSDYNDNSALGLSLFAGARGAGARLAQEVSRAAREGGPSSATSFQVVAQVRMVFLQALFHNRTKLHVRDDLWRRRKELAGRGEGCAEGRERL